ncbi:MAG: dockerin type I domain-containing protein, partial [Planctomycetota bacterium]
MSYFGRLLRNLRSTSTRSTQSSEVGSRAKSPNAAKRPNRKSRRLRGESLEQRRLLAGDLLAHNAHTPSDVDGNLMITPVDALHVISHLARVSRDGEAAAQGNDNLRLDVSGDNIISALDAAMVIQSLTSGESVDDVIQLFLTPTDNSDTELLPVGSRTLDVGINQPFNLEVSYDDLRTGAAEEGIFSLYLDVLTNMPGLEPVMNEIQTLSFSDNINDASTTGNLVFNLEGSTTLATLDVAAYRGNPRLRIRDVMEDLGFDRSEFSVSTAGDEVDILYLGDATANQDLPNLIVDTSQLNVAVEASVRDITPRLRAERQTYTFNAAVVGSNTGNIVVRREGQATTAQIDVNDFKTDPAQQLSDALVTLGYQAGQASVRRTRADNIQLVVDYDSPGLQGMNIDDLEFDLSNLSVPAGSTAEVIVDILAADDINPRAVPFNINFDSRTAENREIYGDVPVGSFTSGFGFNDIGGIAPGIAGGIPAVLEGINEDLDFSELQP